MYICKPNILLVADNGIDKRELLAPLECQSFEVVRVDSQPSMCAFFPSSLLPSPRYNVQYNNEVLHNISISHENMIAECTSHDQPHHGQQNVIARSTW